MKKLGFFSFHAAMAVMLMAGCAKNPTTLAEQNGWKIAAQTYTFNHFTLVQTLDKLKTLNLKYAEIYFGQQLGEGFGKEVMDYHLDAATRSKILKLAKSKGVKILACGVATCGTDKEWQDLFNFAKNMGIEVITSEPTIQQLDFVEKLTEKYKISIAIHNHPKPSTYWNPDTLMAALKGRSLRMGSCADVGHWERMGIDPVKALRICEGRIISLHFKDVAGRDTTSEAAGEFNEQHDVIWGKGVCQVDSMLHELHRQQFKGLFSIEYEYNWDNSVPDLAECITYFNQEADIIFQKK
jgi:sugar phosphate isomerase/epimerase